MMVDGKYFESLWKRFRLAPESLSTDWRHAFEFIEYAFGDNAPSFAQAQINSDDPRAYLRRFGHLHAALDPLGLSTPPALPADTQGATPLQSAYTGTLTVETGHLDPEIADWVCEAFEQVQSATQAPRKPILEQLLANQVFEQFLATKYPGKKRFGSEGADAILPLLHLLRERARADGIEELVIGSMHRGRYSILANFAGMNQPRLFGLIEGAHPYPGEDRLPADMPYHLGANSDAHGINSILLPNPSHLEAVNAVVAGYTRARRTVWSRNAMPIILHTDASVVAQGVNAELVQMSSLPGFAVDGTVHVIINNQIGFTTDPSDARSSRYCSGPWRSVNSLLLHVNGDDVDAVLRAGDLALRFRRQFGLDAVIDLVCYRANGHNEIDEPRFTQPLYYKAADNKTPVAELYARRCVEAGILSADHVDEMRVRLKQEFERAFDASHGTEEDPSPLPLVNAAAFEIPELDDLREIVTLLSQVPDGRGMPKMLKLMERRREEMEQGVTWALAEAMAFACVLRSGISIRLCGQDVERGPFSQRHLAAIDPESGGKQQMLSRFAADGARVEVVNSLLSEYAVLGFEYGFSLAASRSLCIWEAQFGDFANGAQIVVDQFLASGYEKWLQASRLVILLPHGLEGQGPEHSSARIERLLQLCALDNMRVAQPTTPSNYFHLLCHQAASGDRPLFIVTPKVLLRLPQARSSLSAFADKDGFRPVLCTAGEAQANRALLCAGKIAYEVERERDSRSMGLPVIRLEQLYPFPDAELEAMLVQLGVSEIQWLQEEPANFGAVAWLAPRLGALAAKLGIRLLQPIARPESASPAGSFHMRHEHDQRLLVMKALQIESADDGQL
jgi:2-oxoglutarate dehydrogenase E1 component